MAWYKSRREAILAGVKLTPQNREEAVLMGLVKPISENEVKLLESLKEGNETVVETESASELKEMLDEESKPKRKRTKKSE